MVHCYVGAADLQRNNRTTNLFYLLNGMQRRRLQFSKDNQTQDYRPCMHGAGNAETTLLTGGCDNYGQQTRARPDSSGAQSAGKRGGSMIDQQHLVHLDLYELAIIDADTGTNNLRNNTSQGFCIT